MAGVLKQVHQSHTDHTARKEKTRTVRPCGEKQRRVRKRTTETNSLFRLCRCLVAHRRRCVKEEKTQVGTSCGEKEPQKQTHVFACVGVGLRRL